MKKKIYITLACILAIFLVISKLYLSQETTNVIETVQNIVLDEIEKENRIEADAIKENASTTEIQTLSEEEEIQLEEQETENEAFELQR